MYISPLQKYKFLEYPTGLDLEVFDGRCSSAVWAKFSGSFRSQMTISFRFGKVWSLWDLAEAVVETWVVYNCFEDFGTAKFSYKCEVMTPTLRHIPNFRGRLLSLPWKDQVELRLHQKKIVTSLVIPGWVIKPWPQRGKTSRGYNESRPPSTFKRLIPRLKPSRSKQGIRWLQRLKLHAAIKLKYWIDLILLEKQ